MIPAMEWTAPTCTEIKMDAEIGSYQEDFDGERDNRFARARIETAESAAEAVA
jgi:hypothetical protein